MKIRAANPLLRRAGGNFYLPRAQGLVYDGKVTLRFSSHGVLVNHFLSFGLKVLRRDLVGFIGQVLVTDGVPIRHHKRHHQSPDEYNADPE